MESYKVITRNKDIGSNKNLLDKGLIPCIIYGKGTEPKKIAFDNKALQKLMHSKGFYTKILNIEVDGKKEKVLPKALQYHPVTDKLIHLDLLKIQENTKVTVEVPVEFLNQDVCPGLKKGGVLNIVRRTIELICNASSIPEILEFDIAETDIGDSLKISNINLPEGVQPTIRDRDFVIATIVSPTIEVEETKTEEESAEGETGEATEEATATGEEKTEGKKEEADTSKEIKSEKEEDKK